MDDPRQRFSRQERLRKRKEYLRVYDQGTKIQARHLVLYFLVNDGKCSRLGLTVSRKIGKSVVRNRIKRRLREIFRTSKEIICPPSDVVVNVTRSAASASFEDLRGSFLGAVRRWAGECRP